MADVQLENGFTRIANEILDALARQPLNGTQRRIIDIVWRFTYGFSRKQHNFSISFLLEAMELKETQYKQICRELKELLSLNILTELSKPGKNESRIISFNKNYDEWTKKTSGLKRPVDLLDQSSKKTTDVKVAENGHSRPMDLLDQSSKKTSKKEILKKDIKSISDDKKTSSVYAEVIAIFYEHYQNTYHVKYMFNKDRDGSATKRLITQYDLDTIKELMSLYFELEDEYISENGRSISAFASTIVINKCLALKKKKEEYEATAGKNTGLGLRF